MEEVVKENSNSYLGSERVKRCFNVMHLLRYIDVKCLYIKSDFEKSEKYLLEVMFLIRLKMMFLFLFLDMHYSIFGAEFCEDFNLY